MLVSEAQQLFLSSSSQSGYCWAQWGLRRGWLLAAYIVTINVNVSNVGNKTKSCFESESLKRFWGFRSAQGAFCVHGESSVGYQEIKWTASESLGSLFYKP